MMIKNVILTNVKTKIEFTKTKHYMNIKRLMQK